MEGDLDMDKEHVGSEVNSNQEVIGMLLSQASDGEDSQLQIQPDIPEDEVGGAGDHEGGSLLDDGSSLQAVQLTDGTTAIIQQKGDGSILEGQAVQLEDGTTAFIHNLSGKGFEEGQTVQLEDGSTAYIIRTNAKVDGESMQAVQLEDGTTALIQTNVTDFDQAHSAFSSEDPLDAHSLNVLDQYAAQNASEQGGALQLTTGDHDFTSPMRVTVGSVGTTMQTKVEVMSSKTFQCPHEGCGRMYTASHHLKVHERSHSGVKPFRCEHPGCEKAFATGYGLKSHTRVHTGEKPYQCVQEGCLKAFKTSGDLQKHTRTHTGERPFKCPFEGCEKAFTTSNIRKVHIRTHTGERPYICPNEGCGRAFASATNYKNHMRIHTGEKPYVCTVAGCGKRFTEYSSLYKHHVVHTHSKPYMCSSCGKNYRQISTLAMHKRQTHGEDPLIEGLEIAIGQGDRPDIVSILGAPPAKKAKSEYHIGSMNFNTQAADAANESSTQILTDSLNSAGMNQSKTIILRDANGQTRHVTMVSALNRDAALAAMKAAVGNHAMLQVVSDGSLANLSDMQLQEVMAVHGALGEEDDEEGGKPEECTAATQLSEVNTEAELVGLHT
ncbi:zinc finger protein 143 [Strongylocentrotus purpuratus]|uniref:C2H2-type domain-containing protein n=1 Tax=Strongylocentrotus purpuratus TaxID=7668 RepID=A0A7M7P2T3_STRPU|nr:zinc finger protein 143 [Strongylocentrotus purpuratus]